MLMEYHKNINLLDKTPNQPSKFKTKKKHWVEIKDDASGRCNTSNHIKFKITILSLCDHAYIFIKRTISVANMATEGGIIMIKCSI